MPADPKFDYFKIAQKLGKSTGSSYNLVVNNQKPKKHF